MTINDFIRDGDCFPLGMPLGARSPSAPERRPFGLSFAVVPSAAAIADVDWSKISYDAERQIAIVSDENGALLPAMKHTSTQTTTTTNTEDRNTPDDDTDYTGT